MLLSYTHLARAWTLNKERSSHPFVHRKYTAAWRKAFADLAEADVAAGNRITLALVIVRPECDRPPLPDTAACVGAVKAAIDGLVDAGLLPEDGPKVVRRVIFEAPRRTGRDALTVSVRQLRPSELLDDDASPDEALVESP